MTLRTHVWGSESSIQGMSALEAPRFWWIHPSANPSDGHFHHSPSVHILARKATLLESASIMDLRQNKPFTQHIKFFSFIPVE